VLIPTVTTSNGTKHSFFHFLIRIIKKVLKVIPLAGYNINILYIYLSFNSNSYRH
jgi:hypothetical protein